MYQYKTKVVTVSEGMKKHLDGNLEKILNEMSSKGFELVCMETISNTFDVICVFRREKTN